LICSTPLSPLFSQRQASNSSSSAAIKDYLPFPLNLLYPIKAKIENQWVPVKRVPPIYDFLSLLERHRQHV